MKGELLILKPDPDNGIERRPLTGEPGLETLQEIVGGYIELVPYFTTIAIDDEVRDCIALCNEDGKLARPKPLPLNRRATVEWDRAMRRAGVAGGLVPTPGFPADHTGLADHLCGNVAVITGDDVLRAMRTDHDEEEHEDEDEARQPPPGSR